jgi:hypothetical protein
MLLLTASIPCCHSLTGSSVSICVGEGVAWCLGPGSDDIDRLAPGIGDVSHNAAERATDRAFHQVAQVAKRASARPDKAALPEHLIGTGAHRPLQ